jgi:prolipoprotein diacylglyceryl transferase
MVPFGLVGGRLYHVITDPELYFGDPSIPGHYWNPWGVFEIWNGGLGIWGAIALGGLGGYLGARRYKIPFGAVADALAPCIVLAQGIGRLGNYFNQELFGSPTDLPWGLDVYLRTPGGIAGTAAQCGTGEFPTEWIKADPAVLCGTYQPTFLYELLWNVGVAVLVVWADRRFRLGHGRAFALYVAGYTAGRGWIEMLRIDHANHILGLRVNVLVAAAMLLAAVIYLIATRHLRREEPSTVYGVTPGHAHAAGAARKGSSAVADTGAADSDDDDSGARDSLHADSGDEVSDGDEPGATDFGDHGEKSSAGDDAPESDVLRG